MDRYRNGELVKEDTSRHKGPSFKTPAGHIVYGGGGITPDIFVSFDTAKMKEPLSRLYYNNILTNFVYKYYIQNRNYFQSIKSSENLEKQFRPGDKEWKLLTILALKDSLSLSGIKRKEKEDILKKIQELMSRQLFGNEGYIELLNQTDSAVRKGIEVLK